MNKVQWTTEELRYVESELPRYGIKATTYVTCLKSTLKKYETFGCVCVCIFANVNVRMNMI